MMGGNGPAPSGHAAKLGIRPCLVVTITSCSIILLPPAACAQQQTARIFARCGRDWQRGRAGKMGAIDQVLRQAVDAGEVPGVVAMAADDKGMIYQGAFGRRSLASGAPMTLDTVFRIASMTKAITATAAMQM